jgi:cardiolipin synthase
MILYLASLIIFSVGLCAATHALLSKRDSKSALAWIVVCVTLPVVGPIIYLVLGVNRINQKARQAYDPDEGENLDKTLQEFHATNYGQLAKIGEEITGLALRSCEEVRILENGEGLYPSMLIDIGNARKSIFLCTYIFRNDSTGKEIAKALHEAHNRGVDVRLIIDGLGAVVYRPAILKLLRKYQLNYTLFNPLRVIPPSLRINMRNHRKILLVDGLLAYTGGQNISSRHMVDVPLNYRRTRDLHFRLKGKIVDDLGRTFVNDWNHCNHETNRIQFEPGHQQDGSAEVWARPILDGPNQNMDKLNELLVGIISAAKKRVWIMTPYFLPGLDLVGALTGARLKGVDVKILLPERTNIHIAHWASQHNLQFMLARCFSVFLLSPPFIHTKAILIDDNYALVGSANMDPRSLRLNFELDVELFSPEFNSELSKYFQKQLGNSVALSTQQLDSRPRWIKIRDALAWLFTPYL